jgi:diguanylate cyclase (GGDEF)-like protein
MKPEHLENSVALNYRWLRRIEQLDPFAVLLSSLLLIITIGSLDLMASTESGFNFMVGSTLCYLIPVALMAWVGRKKHALSVSLSAAVVDLFTTLNGQQHRHPTAYVLIEVMLEFTLFIFVSILLISLRKAFDVERVASRTDHLTRLFNSRGFSEAAEVELNRMRRFGYTMTVAYLDIDDFKAINDARGHKHGDDVLAAFGDVLLQVTRSVDTPGRLGGDEFAVLLPETDSEQAKHFVARLRSSVERVLRGEATFSVGIVTFANAPESVDTLLEPADAMMYAAKRNGKNTYVQA